MKPSKKDERSINLINRVERMCELLLVEDRTISELAIELCVTESGARNYLRHLRRAELVDVVGKKIFGKGQNFDLLRIKQDRAAIALMLKDLMEQPRTVNLNEHAARSLKQAMASDKTRHIHKMRDNAPFQPKIAPAGAPSRHWLDRAFFGDGLAPSVAEAV